MPTPTLTSACEYASGTISKPTSIKYLIYFMVNLLLSVSASRRGEIAGT
jgi:hypothetical protein